jgi:hypothetical protein
MVQLPPNVLRAIPAWMESLVPSCALLSNQSIIASDRWCPLTPAVRERPRRLGFWVVWIPQAGRERVGTRCHLLQREWSSPTTRCVWLPGSRPATDTDRPGSDPEAISLPLGRWRGVRPLLASGSLVSRKPPVPMEGRTTGPLARGVIAPGGCGRKSEAGSAPALPNKALGSDRQG